MGDEYEVGNVNLRLRKMRTGKTLKEVERMDIVPGTLIEIITGCEVRPVYFAGVDKTAVSYYERGIDSINDVRSKPYFNSVLLDKIDGIVLHTSWGVVK